MAKKHFDESTPMKLSLSHKKCIYNVQFYAAIATIAAAIATIVNAKTSCRSFRYAKQEQAKASIALSQAQETAELVQSLSHQQTLDHEITHLNRLLSLSEAGSRFALESLHTHLYTAITTNHSDEIKFMIHKLHQINRMYSGDLEENPTLKHSFSAPPINPDAIDANLSASNHLSRIIAIHSIKALRLNSHIPILANMAETEPDLNVLQAILFTLNATFQDNYTFNTGSRRTLDLQDCLPPHKEFRQYFNELWAEYGSRILQRKAKFIVVGPDPQNSHLTLSRIVDPEQE